MRLIGHLPDETGARTFGAYLTSVDIANQVDPEDGSWAIWILNEDQISAGQAALQSFAQNPRAPQFQGVEQKAAAIEERRRADARAAVRRAKTSADLASGAFGAPLTLAMIIISVIVTYVCRAEQNRYWIYFSLPEIRHGQVWRLFSPTFLHFGIIHLFFDMWMLFNLGSFLERHEGVWRYLLMTLLMGIAADWAQYVMAGPFFGGFSGVLYGYFGYLWIRSRVAPNLGLSIDPQWVTTMLVWYVLCWIHLVGDVANWDHTGGLLVGMAWGALPKIGLDRR